MPPLCRINMTDTTLCSRHLSPVIGEDGTLHSIVGAQLDVSGFVSYLLLQILASHLLCLVGKLTGKAPDNARQPAVVTSAIERHQGV